MGQTIKLAIDVRDLRIAKTGARTYLEEICRELQQEHPGFSIHFIDTWLPVYTGKNKLLKITEHIRFFCWKQILLPLICFVKGIDILYCTDYFVPCLKLNYQTAVLFHDAFFWEYPEQYNRLWLKLLNTIGLRAARRADVVVTVSEYSRQQIIRYTGIRPERIHAIHLAPKTTHSHPAPKQQPEQQRPNPAKKYILHVGVLEKRKNLPNLIRAYSRLLQEGYTDYDLVLAGGRINKEKIDDSAQIQQLIKDHQLEGRVILPGFVADAALEAYYANATVYAFVSVNEGFGLPVLEAFQHHLPTLISDNSSLPEVGGDAVVTCNPFDVNDITEKLKMIICNPALQQQLKEKGRQRLAQFSWQKSTEALLQLFQAIHGASNPPAEKLV
ncbi:MAG TPA: glycosyltransferase family 1 protein [Sediminibacterium sp.]|nr:glycosyltransferase family 1 protein [Sediminibacterium sp.]